MKNPQDEQPLETPPPPRPPRATAQDRIDAGEIEPPILPQGNSSGGRFNMRGGAIQTIVISVVVAILVFMGMGILGFGNFVTKKGFTANMQGIVTTLDKAKADLATSKTAVDNAVAGITDKVNTQVNSSIASVINQINSNITSISSKIDSVQVQVQTAISNSTNALSKSESVVSSITNINASINSIKADIGNLQASLTTLNNTITALTVRVKTLEDEQVATPTSPTDLLTFTVNTISNMPVTMTISANNTVYSGTWQLIIKNNTNKVVDQLVLGVGIISATGTPFPTATWVSGYPQLISNGGSVLWTYQPSGAGLMFVSGWGYGVSQLSIPANSQISLWLTLQLDVTTTPIIPLYYQLVLQPFMQSYHQP